jgi:hypothetical protein
MLSILVVLASVVDSEKVAATGRALRVARRAVEGIRDSHKFAVMDQ